MRSKARWFGWAALAGLLCPGLCFALMTVEDRGTWPDSWPEQLEPYRKQAKTYGVAHGIQENVYEIRFDNREDFEKAWPHILTLKSKGAPLILESPPSNYSRSGSTMGVGVRVLWPSMGTVGVPGGKALRAGPPWPESLTSPTGVLPEYVVAEKETWAPADQVNRAGFLNRARVDIILVADGKTIDLNRIHLPADTPILDRRKLDAGSR